MKKDKEWSDPEDLERSLSKGKVYPLYYLYGNDQYLLERGVRQIKAKVLTSSPESTVTHYSASEAIPADILNDARTLPFFSPSRFIMVKEAHLFKTAHWKEFLSYLKGPVASTTLLFLGEKMELGKESYDLLKNRGMVVRFNHPFESQLPQWIRKIARECEKDITPEAISLLREVAGNDLLRIASELGKISIYCGRKGVIDAEAVEEVVAEARMETIFTLIDCIGKKERDKSLKMLWRLIDSGKPPLLILSLISRQIRLIARGKEMMQEGKDPYDLVKDLKIQKFKLDDFQDQLSRFSLSECKKIFTALALTDLALKSSRLSKGIILERLVLEICN
ncbi:MAG TPA: DNA polymerase III subunit delta [Thermodesulfobacteriota bacterium]|nr:DNA polymerase III subunit delta [Thermodesulfobacteriota bacterium]